MKCLIILTMKEVKDMKIRSLLSCVHPPHPNQTLRGHFLLHDPFQILSMFGNTCGLVWSEQCCLQDRKGWEEVSAPSLVLPNGTVTKWGKMKEADSMSSQRVMGGAL